jgi:adenine deaminase
MRDLLVENASIVDVITQRTYHGWFSIQEARFLEVEEGQAPSPDELPAHERLDLHGQVVQPGLIDTHMHIESSLVTPRRFAEAVLPWGTTTILQDPHEIANVLGAAGIRWMIHAGQNLPLRIFTAISSCVPATSDAIETPNARLIPEEVLELAQEQGVLALGEMMDYQGLLEGSAHLKAILAAGRKAGLSLEGHVPTLSGRALSRYIAHGIRSDHTLMTPSKLVEELRKGLCVMLQEKSLTPDVVQTIASLPDRSRVLLITDDIMPNRLRNGHLNRILETAIAEGWDPVDALASATIRPATYLGLRDLGAIAPGYCADFTVCPALNTFPPEQVYVSGKLVANRGSALPLALTPSIGETLTATSFAVQDLPESFFRVTDSPEVSEIRARIIQVNERNTFTTLEECTVAVSQGTPAGEDLCLAVVIARQALQEPVRGRGNVGLVSGVGLRAGAFATTFAHDSHNVFVIGKTPAAMRRAVQAVLQAGGGMAVAPTDDGAVVLLPLPIAGLLADEPVRVVGAQFDELEQALRQLGVRAKNPVLLFTILPLTVSPAYKISDKGIVDVEARRVLEPVLTP